jgi:hypothetical protein
MSDAHIQEALHDHERQHHNGRAQPLRVTEVHPLRLIFWTVVIVLISVAAMAWVSSMKGESFPKELSAFALGVAIIPFLASPIEWFVHRFVYNQPAKQALSRIYSVHIAHHFAYFPTWRYVTGGSARRLTLQSDIRTSTDTFWGNAAIRLTHFTWCMAFGALFMWLPGWIITKVAVFLSGLIIGSVIVSNLFIVVHDTIHRPGSHRIVETQPWFTFLDNHHYIHHVSLGANLNFLLPMADLLFRTLRTQLTPEELRAHGSLKRAKMIRVGEGEPVHTMN